MNRSELRLLLAGTDTAISETIEQLSAKPDYQATRHVNSQPIPVTMDMIRDEYEVLGHAVFDRADRKDKPVKTDTGVRMELVNRIGIGFQELITDRAVSFLFGLPVKITATPDGDKQQSVFDALRKILKKNKIDPFNAGLALDLFRSKEVAEIWYVTDTGETSSEYGFPTKFKLRVLKTSPWDGTDLFPLFDENGDMVAFSRRFTMPTGEGKTDTYFETYTAEELIVWRKSGNVLLNGANEEWVLMSRVPNPIKKIPVVYARQDRTEWETVQSMIERLEKKLSNDADTNDYHSSPTVLITGEITGMPDKGETGKIIKLKNGADAKYLSWQQAPEQSKLEIDTLFKLIYAMSQTPDISFESIKGIGAVSGVALKLMFTDAHLKVKKKQQIFDAYLDRRSSIILSFIGMMNTGLAAETKLLDVESEIQPFMIGDEEALVNMLTTATGGLAVISQRSAVAQTGLVEDADAEYEQIQAEAVASATAPTM